MILQFPNPILTTPCEDITDFSSLKDLSIKMLKIVKELNAVGLSANQIGVSKRIFVMVVKGKEYIFINPVLERYSGESVEMEGCLSQTGVYKNIGRSENVVVEYRDLYNSKKRKAFSGLAARCVQHELDHLDGKNPLELV